MNTHGVSLHARGMHCSGCERVIEDSARKLPGVQRVKADYATETVSVVFDPALTNVQAICAAVAQKGYRCALPEKVRAPRKWVKKLVGVFLGVAGILLIMFLDTKYISASGAPDVSRHMGYGLILVLGLLTGFHCVGMCGGFVVSYTAADARLGQSSFLSHVIYGSAKTLSYTIVGAMFGLLGAVIAFTPMLRGVAGIVAGIFLIVFGLNMLNVFPALRKIRLRLPASLSQALSGEQKRSRNRPATIGALNGLMIACGPLQAMYVMAAGTGSAVEGAKMLFTFGVGTLPVMLGFGFLTSLISAALTHRLLRASGAILILLGAVMMNRGLILTGAGYDLQSVVTSASRKLGFASAPLPMSPVESNVQIIYMDITAAGYEPNHFVLRRGVPVRWIIDGKELTECNRRIVVPKLGLEFDIRKGVQTIEFTPDDAGDVYIPWSCWMGMLHGGFDVVGAHPAQKGEAVAVSNEPLTSPAPTTTPARPEEQAAVAPLEPSAPTATPALQPAPARVDAYTIAVGDSLSGIAAKLYRDPQEWRAIAKANPGLEPRRLRPGQVIKLPRPVGTD